MRQDPTAREWFGHGAERELLMSIFDAVQNLSVLTAKVAAGKKGSRIKAAKPYPRPRAHRTHRPSVTLAQIAENLRGEG